MGFFVVVCFVFLKGEKSGTVAYAYNPLEGAAGGAGVQGHFLL